MCLFHSTSSFQALQALQEELDKSDSVGIILIDLSMIVGHMTFLLQNLKQVASIILV